MLKCGKGKKYREISIPLEISLWAFSSCGDKIIDNAHSEKLGSSEEKGQERKEV